MPLHLATAGIITAWSGAFGAAAALIAESEAVCEATGARIPSYAALVLAGLRGSPAEAVPLLDATINAAEAAGPASGKGTRRLVKQMKAVQSVLGDHQDAVNARSAARELGVRANLAGESSFSFGLLYERAHQDALRQQHRARRVWKRTLAALGQCRVEFTGRGAQRVDERLRERRERLIGGLLMP